MKSSAWKYAVTSYELNVGTQIEKWIFDENLNINFQNLSVIPYSFGVVTREIKNALENRELIQQIVSF